jgi:hypothetical protein
VELPNLVDLLEGATWCLLIGPHVTSSLALIHVTSCHISLHNHRTTTMCHPYDCHIIVQIAMCQCVQSMSSPRVICTTATSSYDPAMQHLYCHATLPRQHLYFHFSICTTSTSSYGLPRVASVQCHVPSHPYNAMYLFFYSTKSPPKKTKNV